MGGSPAENTGFGLSPERKTAPTRKSCQVLPIMRRPMRVIKSAGPEKGTKAEILGG
jgi:hypothetical protein